MSHQKKIEGYWFGHVDADGVVRLGFRDGRVVRAGETLRVTGIPVLCEHGLHASRQVLDALRYALGPILACVRLSGTITEGDDKLAATARETVWLGDVSAILHRFACDVAERALLAERAAGREPDPRSWAAITVKKRWLNGEASDAELSEACDAAWDAAWDAENSAWGVAAWAAKNAAWAAAWAAENAAWAAARATAEAVARAAENAAWDAAWTAVGTAAGAAAARGDAWHQECAWQKAHACELLREAGVPMWKEEAL